MFASFNNERAAFSDLRACLTEATRELAVSSTTFFRVMAAGQAKYLDSFFRTRLTSSSRVSVSVRWSRSAGDAMSMDMLNPAVAAGGGIRSPVESWPRPAGHGNKAQLIE